MSIGMQPRGDGFRQMIRMLALICILSSMTGCRLSSLSTEDLFRQGVEAVSNHRYEEAVGYFKKAIERDSTFAPAHYRLGEVYSRMGERQAAILELSQALMHAPHMVEARKLLTSLFYQSKQYDQAIGLIQSMEPSLKMDPDVVSIHAACLIETGNLQQADAILKQALETHPNHIALNLTFARLQALHQNVTGLQTILEALIRQYPEDISIRLAGFALLEQSGGSDLSELLIRNAIEQFPSDPKPVLLLAKSHIQKKRYVDAQQLLLSATTLAPAVEVDQYLGLIAHHEGDTQEALRRFVHAAEQFPDHISAQLLAGDYALLTGNHDTAEFLYYRALQKWPYIDDLRIRLIRLYLADNRIESAESQLNRLRFSEAYQTEGTLLKGIISAKKGVYEEAMAAFSRVIQQEPESAEAHYFYGLCFLARKDYALAASELHTALKLRKDSQRIRLSLAYVYFRQHKWLAALEEVNGILSQNPHMAEARKLRAAIYLQQQRYEKAILDYRWLLERDPDTVQIRYWLAEALNAEGKLEEALGHFRQVIVVYPRPIKPLEQMVFILMAQAKYPQAIALCEEMASKIEDQTGLSLLKAIVYMRQKDYGQAQAVIDEAIRRHPGSDIPLLVRAYLDEIQGRRMESVEWYQKAIRLNPNNVLSYSKMARTFRHLGQTQQAIETYESLLRLRPDDAPAMNNLAYLYWETGMHLERALKLAQDALKWMPDQPEILDTLGCIHLDLGAITTAEKYLAEAFRASPENSVFRLHVAMLRKRQGRLKEARQEIEKALKLGLHEADRRLAERQLNAIASLEKREQETIRTIQSLIQKGNLEEASELARSELERSPDSIELLNMMGQIYDLSGLFPMSSMTFRKALRLEPERAELHYRLARALYQLGQLDEAQTELSAAIRLGLEGRDRKDAERILRELRTGRERP